MSYINEGCFMKKSLLLGTFLLVASALQAQDTTPGFWERTKQVFRRGVEKVTPGENSPADTTFSITGAYGSTYQPTHVAYGAHTGTYGAYGTERAVERGWERTKGWTQEAWEKAKETFRNLAQRTREVFGGRTERQTSPTTTPVTTPTPSQRPVDVR